MFSKFPLCVLISLLSTSATIAFSQSAQQEIPPATPIPHVIRYTGIVDVAPGRTLTLKFALYENQTGGDAVWSESQQVTPDPAGKYSVLLGAATETGLPQNVFSSAQAKWLGITVGDGQESPRTILVATPYSLKASDSETLGGHPASDFTLNHTLPAGGTDITQINVGSGITGGGTGPTVTLGLSSGYLESLGNQVYPQLTALNTLTGVNKYTAGNLLISGSPALSVANVSASSPVTIAASGSAIKIGLSDSALLTLGNGVYAQLAAANTFTQAQTFSAPITFASGQTFPGTVSLSANNTFTGGDTFSKPITFASGQTFPGTGTGNGTITGITTTSPLSGSGTSGSVALSLNTSALETTLNSIYPTLSANNSFTGSNTFSQPVTFAGGQAFSGTASLSANNTFTGTNHFATSTSFGAALSAVNIGPIGVEAVGNDYGIYASVSDMNPNNQTFGVFSETYDYGAGSYAVFGYAPDSGLSTGVYGGFGGNSDTGYAATTVWGGPGVWADSTTNPTYPGVSLLASADESMGALITNNSSSGNYTLLVKSLNDAAVPFAVANEQSGTDCEIDNKADLLCSGKLEGSLVTTANSVDDREVASYGVQSAENWIEDAGSGQLASGRSHVDLEPHFGQVANTELEYHVFLTPEGDCKGLYIANKSATGFDVRELSGGKSSIAFSYRIMAKRKGFESARLEDITAQVHQGDKALREPPPKSTPVQPHRFGIPMPPAASQFKPPAAAQRQAK